MQIEIEYCKRIQNFVQLRSNSPLNCQIVFVFLNSKTKQEVSNCTQMVTFTADLPHIIWYDSENLGTSESPFMFWRLNI